jgi:hypothetical protein
MLGLLTAGYEIRCRGNEIRCRAMQDDADRHNSDSRLPIL